MKAWKNARKTYDDNHGPFYDVNLAGNNLAVPSPGTGVKRPWKQRSLLRAYLKRKLIGAGADP